ncbi:hypothetical protein GFV16_13635 [Bacillus megaterium]|uniref:hypothetical protein n=1 Tax=Priestia megaterium TaxID=1404 RepID=UPI001293DC9F|nr:hypothetical protein [Priestia megaterium]MQR86955.1 hypothetical protein [Priestia megaterium]
MIPETILAEAKDHSEVDWVEEHDLLVVSNLNPFDSKNQVDWWKKNVEIRKAFRSTEKEIKDLIKNNQKITVRVLTWVKIAKLANCDRNTLRHPKRIAWTEEKFNFLRQKILHTIDAPNDEPQQVNKWEQKILELEGKLVKARNETAIWMDQYYVITEKNKTLQAVLQRKEHELFGEKQKINELIKTLDDIKK